MNQTIEDMLNAAIKKLQGYNKELPCRENAIALTKIEEAILWLNRRTENRKACGVEGTKQPH